MSASPHTNLPRAFAFLMAAHILFVLLDATGKALVADMGVPLISLVRHAGHALLMLAVLGPTLGMALLRTSSPMTQLVRGLLLSGFTLFFFTALGHLPQAEATAINFLSPFFVMLLAGPMLGEAVTWRRWVGAAGGFAGMLLIVRPGSGLATIGVVFALLTVLCNIGFQLLTRRLAVRDNSTTTVFLTSLVGTAVSASLLPVQDAWGGWPQALEMRHWLLFGSLALVGVLSQWCLIRAYYWSSASFIAPLVFLQIVWATLSGQVFFGQLPDLVTLAGMAIICASGIGSTVSEARAARRRAAGGAATIRT